MIEWRLTPEDVARVRLAFSPLMELVLSLVVLRTPARHALHLPWIRAARADLAGLDLAELFALVPVRGIVADFLTPPPDSPLPDLDDELDLVRRTPADRVVEDLAVVPGVPRGILDRVLDDPEAAVERLVRTLRAYADRTFTSSWPRIRALLEADVLWRSRRLARGGPAALFEDLHPTVTWHGDRVSVADPYDHAGTLTGEGLLLVPSAMAWPTVRKMIEPHQPVVLYPARGVATLWETGPPPTTDALSALLGRTRARLLVALAEPGSTTLLAERFSLTPSAVSQHLSVLRANGLVTGARVAGSVLYRRTTRGDAFLATDHG